MNVNRSGYAQLTALELALEENVDILLVQERCLHWEDSRKITKSHPQFNTLTPSRDWTRSPRNMTYVRKKRGFTATYNLVRIADHSSQGGHTRAEVKIILMLRHSLRLGSTTNQRKRKRTGGTNDEDQRLYGIRDREIRAMGTSDNQSSMQYGSCSMETKISTFLKTWKNN